MKMAMSQAEINKLVAENAELKASNEALTNTNEALTNTNDALMEGVRPFFTKINKKSGTIGIGGAGIEHKWFHATEAAALVANEFKYGLQMLHSMQDLLTKHAGTEWGGAGSDTLCYKASVKKAYNASPEGIAAKEESAAKYKSRRDKTQIDIND
jgi:hypothetical protein